MSTIIENQQDCVNSNAIWTDALLHVQTADEDWLYDNATGYIIEQDLFNVDYVLITNEEQTFTSEYGGAHFDALMKTPEIQIALEDNEIVTFFTDIDGMYGIATASPITDNDEKNPSGLYLVISFFDDARTDELIGILGSDLKGYTIFKEDEPLVTAYLADLHSPSNATLNIDIPGREYLIQLDFDITKTQETFDKNKMNTIYMISISALAVLVIILTFLLFFTRRIKDITTNVIKISEGDYDLKYSLHKNKAFNEMNLLANAVYKMSDDIKKHISTINMHYVEMADVIISAVEANDKYTSRHNIEVGIYAQIIAKQIKYQEIDNLFYAAKLHDIGKISIPSHILNKPGRLTDEEFDIIKTHPVEGYKIIDNIEFFNNIKYGVKHHHEHWDGTGYPDGLKGNEIPLIAQIIAIADTYDAVTSDRSYRKGMTHEKAVEIIVQESGTLFNPLLVEAFMNCQDEFEQYLESIKNER